MEHIILNGVNSNTINGLVIKKMPSITLAKRDIESINVDGRNGKLHIDNGTYESYNETIECVVTDLTQINAIKTFLKPIGTIVFSTIPNVEYDYVIRNQVSFDKYLTVVREFPLQLELHPIGRSATLTTVTKTLAGTFTALGNVAVKPTLEIKGTGTATITLNSVAFSLTNLDATATIVDCDLMNVTKGVLQANDKFTGTFPSVVVGENNISWTGTISEIKIKYKSGWL